MLMKRVFSVVLGILCVLTFAGRTFADVSGVDVMISPENTLVMKLIHEDYFPGGINAYIGGYKLTYSGDEAAGYHLGDIGYCIEMQFSSSQKQPYSVIDLWKAPVPYGPDGLAMGQQKAAYIEAFWGQHFGSVSDSVSNAAFQLAVWEIVFEEPLNWDVAGGSIYTTGGSTASANARDLASTWLNEYDPDGPRQPLAALSNSSYQDYVVAVPLPGSLVLVGIGLGAVGVAVRMRRGGKLAVES